jgi:hypothetical protein
LVSGLKTGLKNEFSAKQENWKPTFLWLGSGRNEDSNSEEKRKTKKLSFPIRVFMSSLSISK